jgi:hypothetical protein
MKNFENPAVVKKIKSKVLNKKLLGGTKCLELIELY